MALDRREGVLVARVGTAASALMDLTRDLDRTDEALATGGVAEMGDGSFRVMEFSERTAAFFGDFLDGFIEEVRSVAVWK